MQKSWTIIGSGPAGLLAIGKLLDLGINPNDILCIDNQHKVGDFGTIWQNVPSNTTCEMFTDFFNSCKSFNFAWIKNNFVFNDFNLNDTCLLKYPAEILQYISNNFKKIIEFKTGLVSNIDKDNGIFKITCNNNYFYSNNIILATGSKYKKLDLNLDNNIDEIDLKVALNPELLAKNFNKNDCIAIFGSSHSSVLAMKNLIDLGAKNIINFFRSPLKYAIPTVHGILYDNTGLKGTAATWAKEVLEKDLNKNIIRVKSNSENLNKYIKNINKIIYTVGFERRNDIAINGSNNFSYDEQTGIIELGIYGLGIAFPDKFTDYYGITEHRVGLYKFALHADKVMPLWLNYN